MRLFLELHSVSDMEYDNQYHYYIQGLIYNLIKTDKDYSYLHDKKGYKFFCFSNIFPYTKMLGKDKRYNLLISSPDEEFIKYMYRMLSQHIGQIIFFGKMNFHLTTIKIFSVKIPSSNTFILKTETPIIIRIPSKLLDTEKKYTYYYWKKEFPLGLFISQIEKNLYKKYQDFIDYKISDTFIKEKQIKELGKTKHINLFEKFIFKKQISTRIRIRDIDHIIIGSLWEFHFEGWQDQQMIQFALDVGLGERNSLGFGFLNLIEKN